MSESVERMSTKTNISSDSVWIVKSSITGFFSKSDQFPQFPSAISSVNLRNFLRIWSHLLKKPSMENFIFCEKSWQSMILKTKSRSKEASIDIKRREHR